MKILVVTQYYYPEQFRITDICEELAKNGHEVTVLTGLPNYPEGKILKDYKWFRNRNQKIKNVIIKRTNLIGRGSNPIKLCFNYLSFMINGSIRARLMIEKYDVVYCYQMSPITQMVAAINAKKHSKCKLVISCLDIWPESLKSYGINENSFIYKQIGKFSSYLYRKCDKILVSSNGFTDYLVTECKVKRENISFLANHAENEYLTYSNAIHSRDKVKFLFAGNIGKAQNLQVIIKALSVVKPSSLNRIEVGILGDGSYMKELKKLVIENKLENSFKFYGRKPLSKIKKYYEDADVFLLTLEGGTFVSNTIPAKLQGYMGAGRPIAGCINGGSMDIIKEAKCGLCAEADDYKGLAEIFEKYICDSSLLEEYGNNGREYFKENFTIEKFISSLERTLEKEC
ncbi:MAG: glycosyltransferase family 4 protein [Erysipelotrichaceae bacterium]